MDSNTRPVPHARIVYEPSPVYRMRYEAENRSTHLFAENYISDKENSSSSKNRKRNQATEGQYPRIEIINGEGPATLIVSCVNKTEPYYVHPHKLVGTNCKHGVAVFNIDKGQNIFDISCVSIQYTKKSDIEKRILELKEKNVDPFNLGFDFERSTIDLNCVRLCFQIYLRDSFDTTEIIRDKYHILNPLVSQMINNSCRKISLSIISTFNLHSTCDGGSDVIIFIKKLEKDQKPLRAKFYDSDWSQIVEIEDSKIHYQCAISFKAPPYPKKIDKDTTVFFKLFIPFKSDEERDMDDEDSMEYASQTSPNSNNLNELKQLGQYESRQIEFVYSPSISNSYESIQNMANDLFCFTNQSDRDAVSNISNSSRRNLRNRFSNINNINFSQSNYINNDFDEQILSNNEPENNELFTNQLNYMNNNNNDLENNILTENNGEDIKNQINSLNTNLNENIINMDDFFSNLLVNNLFEPVM